MGQKSGQDFRDGIPEEAHGLNVNCCSNPKCENFQVPVKVIQKDKNYTLTGKDKSRSIRCRACGRHVNLKSNYAIFEEFQRLQHLPTLAKIYKQDGYCCHNLECENFGLNTVKFPHLYRKTGKTSSQNQRFQCKSCLLRFTQGSLKRKSHPESKSHENTQLYKLICNRGVRRRLSEVTDLSQPTIYRKIDMFYERSVAFMASREERLVDMDISWMRLSVDKQFYNVNWTSRRDQRNVVLEGIGSGDRMSGYIFGMDINYDPSINLDVFQKSNEYQADTYLPSYLRNSARFWTDLDYKEQTTKIPNIGKIAESWLDELVRLGSPIPLATREIEHFLEEHCRNNGVELNEQTENTKLPNNGALVHTEYTMYAHFIKLRKLLSNVSRVVFYLDCESGIDRALLSAFNDWVESKRITAMFVSSDKSLGTHKRQALDAITKKHLQKLIEDGHADNLWEASVLVALDYIEEPIEIKSNSNEVWYSVPVHRVFECDKHVSFITDVSDWKPEWKAARAVDASLRTTDSFFNLVRRRLSVFERPIVSRTNKGVFWDGYSPYNPQQVEKMIQILRCYYNYVKPSEKDGKTPAMRLGLAKGPVEIRKILYPY